MKNIMLGSPKIPNLIVSGDNFCRKKRKWSTISEARSQNLSVLIPLLSQSKTLPTSNFIVAKLFI
jgi:hypothetical protein